MTTLVLTTEYGWLIEPICPMSVHFENLRIVPRTDPVSGEDDSYEIGDLVIETNATRYVFCDMIEPQDFFNEYLDSIPYSECVDDGEDPCLFDDRVIELYVSAIDPDHHFSDFTVTDKPRIQEKIICNKILCRHCGGIIESRTVHEFVTCKCGKCSVDGGRSYLKRVCAEGDYIELSVIRSE